AGIYARTDEERGVHKAPANAAGLGALNVKYYISKAKQELLNPQGVNCIRNMNGNITVWARAPVGGARKPKGKKTNFGRSSFFLPSRSIEGSQWGWFEQTNPHLLGRFRA